LVSATGEVAAAPIRLAPVPPRPGLVRPGMPSRESKIDGLLTKLRDPSSRNLISGLDRQKLGSDLKAKNDDTISTSIRSGVLGRMITKRQSTSGVLLGD
jgi:hypothetical protein